jgi:hypothetical protein
MKVEGSEHTSRLRLLALVLYLALTWYALNPAPGPVQRVERDEGQSDEKRRTAQFPLDMRCALARLHVDAMASAEDPASSVVVSIDDLEWPEVIDVS